MLGDQENKKNVASSASSMPLAAYPTHPGPSPILNWDITQNEVNMANYYFHWTNYFLHQHSHMLFAANQHHLGNLEPSKPKRRKLHAPAEEETVSLVQRKGNVTFRPYSDNLSNKDLMLSRRGEAGDSKPLKRKVPASSNLVKSSGDKSSRSKASEEDDDDVVILDGPLERAVVEKMTIQDLMPELISMIVEKLDTQSKGRAACVCRDWRDAVYRKAAWTNQVAKLHLGKPHSIVYPSLNRRGIKSVQVLSLRRSLRELTIGLKNLTSLSLSGCYNLSDSVLEHAFNAKQPRLKHLDLSLCKEISDHSLKKVTKSAQNLVSLNLAGCTKITDHGLSCVRVFLDKLEYLNLRSCRHLSDDGLQHLLSPKKSWTDESSSVSRIKELVLQDCQKLSDDCLRHLAAGQLELRALNLSFCVNISDAGLEHLASVKNLETLNLRSCDNISDSGLGHLVNSRSKVPSIKNLDVSFCNNVSDSGIRILADGMPKLECLSMTTCAVSDEGLKKMAKGLTQLRTLNMGQCTLVTDSGLLHLVEKLPHLETLDLYGCRKLTDETIGKLKAKLKKVNMGLW